MSALRKEVLEMNEWRQLPKPGKHTGVIGTGTANLWEWTLSYREESATTTSPTLSSGSWECSEQTNSVEANKLELTAINKTIFLATRQQPLKETGTNVFLFAITETLAGFKKEDPPVKKKLPVGVGVVEYLVKLGMQPGAEQKVVATGDWSLIAFYSCCELVNTRSRAKRPIQSKP
jgi:hypothetical protein